MRYTASHLYLGSLPKTVTTSTDSVIPGDTCIGDEAGHSRAWMIPRTIRKRRLVWGSTAPPGVWLARMYLHAVDSPTEGLLMGLRAYGCNRVDFRSVVYGMTHTGQVALPYQAGLIFHIEPLAAVALQCSGVGLWTFCHRYFFGDQCPSPAEVHPWGVDALVDSMRIEDGIEEVMGQRYELPRLNARPDTLKAWLAEQWDDEMEDWVREADGALMDELGYDGLFGARRGGPVWRPPA